MEKRTESVPIWNYPERDRRTGQIVKPGYWSTKRVERAIPPRKEPVNGGMHPLSIILGTIAVVAILWLWSLTFDDGAPGACRTEPGYMGRQEIVECYER